MNPLTCSRCGEEVRYGARGNVLGWLHREEKDHAVILGFIASDEEKARWESELDKERTRMVTKTKGKGDNKTTYEVEETYTARTISMTTEAKKAEAEADDDEDVTVEVIPEPEQRATPVEVDSFAPRSGIRQILNLLSGDHKNRVEGWELVSLTASRGPYIGSSGKVLSISDVVLLRAREVDSGPHLAVASWRDGSFDFAYTGVLHDGVVTSTAANSMALKAWIKGESRDNHEAPDDSV